MKYLVSYATPWAFWTVGGSTGSTAPSVWSHLDEELDGLPQDWQAVISSLEHKQAHGNVDAMYTNLIHF